MRLRESQISSALHTRATFLNGSTFAKEKAPRAFLVSFYFRVEERKRVKRLNDSKFDDFVSLAPLIFRIFVILYFSLYLSRCSLRNDEAHAIPSGVHHRIPLTRLATGSCILIIVRHVICQDKMEIASGPRNRGKEIARRCLRRPRRGRSPTQRR